MRVFYISRARREERPLLENSREILFKEVSIELRRDIGPAFLAKIYNCYRVVADFKPDVILAESPGFYAVFGVFLARLKDIPVAVRLKGNPWDEINASRSGMTLINKVAAYLNNASTRWMLKNTTAILPISSHILKCADRELKGGVKGYVVHIPFREPVVSGEALPYGGFVLTVTNFNFWGKVRPLVDAVPLVYPVLERLGLVWVILGDGIYLEKSRGLLEGYGDRVKLIGRQDVHRYYEAALFLLYISGMDGLPNVILEASNTRLPVVMNSDCPAVEFIKDGHNGVVVDFADPVKVSSVVERMALDETWRRHLGENAYEYVRDNFSVAKVSEELESALKSCINDADSHS